MGKKNFLFGALLRKSLKRPKADESSQSINTRCLAKIVYCYLIKFKKKKQKNSKAYMCLLILDCILDQEQLCIKNNLLLLDLKLLWIFAAALCRLFHSVSKHRNSTAVEK